ncbi:uncharacterized protein [Nicotiana tomentosiformis]|uniref:uncharacterized protein n=1 Tax=Nicotiana tomentosiformis TaxID=4098 RepID=UPI00388C57DE
MIHDAQAVEVYHGEGAHGEEVPFRGYFVGVEDATGPSDLEASKKSSGKAGIPRIFSEAQLALNQQFDPAGSTKARMIGQLRTEVDVVKAGAGELKKNMDHLASEKEAARAQLASVEAQLRSSKERALVQVKNIEEFQSRLGSVTSDRERLASELAAAKSEAEIAMANAGAMMAIYRSDAEAAQVRVKEVAEASQARENWVAEHAKYQSRRETLEEIHARGFDLTAEIENAKELEAEARVLAFPDDDDTKSMSGSESEGGLEVKMLLL